MSRVLQMPVAGAFTVAERAPVPLVGVDVRAKIEGFASRVTLRQRFRNAEAVPVEAVYVFPLPEAAAVCSLLIETGGRRLVGRVLERDEAFDAYDDAMLEGYGAVLLDAERPNVFTASVGNLLPGQELTVELGWVAELALEGEALRFVLPSTVAPRYAPAGDETGVGPSHAARVNPPRELSVPYGFTFAAEVRAAGGVKAVASPSHPVRVEAGEDGTTRVSLTAEASPMDRDLVLLVEPRRTGEPWAALELQDSGQVVAAVSLVPRLGAGGGRLPREVAFLVDRSGSMDGSSIEQVRRALRLCLASLRPGDRFQIVGFGSTFRLLYTESQPYSDAWLADAMAHVDALDANLGGTEVLPALEAVLSAPVPAGLEREVVLLTDGEVSNEDEVIALAAGHAGACRIFTFGIGHGASEYLVRALARVTGGACEMVLPSERLEPKVMRQFARIGRARLRDVEVRWEGAGLLRQVPEEPTAVFDGEPLLLYAFLDEVEDGRVTLSGRLGAETVSWSVPLDPASVRDGDLLGPLAARAVIRELEELAPSSFRHRGSQQRDRLVERAQAEIVGCAMEYGLVSSLTSLVAVEEREGAEDAERAELRRIPVTLTHGWGGIEETAHRLMSPSMPAPPAFSRRRGSGPAPTVVGEDAVVRVAYSMIGGPHEDGSTLEFQRRRPALAEGPFQRARLRRRDPARERLDALVRLQRADGRWELDEELAAAVGVAIDELRAAAARLGSGAELAGVVATAAALATLRRNLADFEAEWRLLADKAEAWLASVLARPGLPTRGALDGEIAES